ncbi:MAG: hypothetical protein NVS9B15_09740 [Acidobacteriaceae bacterium]
MQRAAIAALLEREKFDCVHDMSGSWFQHAADVSAAVLATVHLPRSFYSPDAFAHVPCSVAFNCVSQSQFATFSALPGFLEPVPNGIALDCLVEQPLVSTQERDYLLWLGRICEEKGPHHALDAAFAAGERMILAGTVYPLLYHQQFFAREVLPRLRRSRNRAKYIPHPSFDEKRNLLRYAKAVIITSTAPETSSLVAMEAAACGTPVIALRVGAIPEILREGVTGWIGDDLSHLRALLPLIKEIRPEDCRQFAVQHFDAARMADLYVQRYKQLLGRETQDVALHA